MASPASGVSHARNRKSLLELISLSLRAYAPFFRSLLRLKGETVPHNRKELYKNIEKAFNISGEPLQRVADSNNVKDLPELEKLFSDYVKAIRAIIEVIDQCVVLFLVGIGIRIGTEMREGIDADTDTDPEWDNKKDKFQDNQ